MVHYTLIYKKYYLGKSGRQIHLWGKGKIEQTI